jgi:tetratricopeptide (TPR) repeat protein
MIDACFLEQLAGARSEIEFNRTAAGFAALQMYDSVKTRGYDPAVHSASLDRIREDVSAITSEASVHAALDSFIQVLPFWEAGGVIRVGRRAVYTSLLIYGQALGDEGEWRLAQQVYSIVGMDAELDGETWISAEARLMMGRASRMCADWEESRIAYVRAYELGVDAGDFALALRARIGEANNLWSRGDLPAAKQLLNATARRARESCPEILPRITLAIAGVANAAGEYERAIHIAFGLLGSLSESDELRSKTLVDLAAFLTDYGLPDVASAALRIVERAAPEAQIRVHARLNLFFLAARHQDEVEFEVLRLALTRDPLTPRQQTQYALFSAQGFRRFAQLQTALNCVEQAIKLANQFQLFQLMFEAESEMQAIEAARTQADKVATQRPHTSKPVRARVAGGTGGSADIIETIFEKSATRETIPPRIRRVAESLRSMALATADVDAARFTH